LLALNALKVEGSVFGGRRARKPVNVKKVLSTVVPTGAMKSVRMFGSQANVICIMANTNMTNVRTFEIVEDIAYD
jgi:hypothetical protein